jgi:autophagy-related protein 9
MAGTHSSYHSGSPSEGSEEELDRSNNSSWRSPQALSKMRYIDESHTEAGLSLHFADAHQTYEDDRPGAADHQNPFAPAELNVRVIPRSSDPV